MLQSAAGQPRTVLRDIAGEKEDGILASDEVDKLGDGQTSLSSTLLATTAIPSQKHRTRFLLLLGVSHFSHV